MFGFSSFSELPLSTQENDAAVILTGQSLDLDDGVLAAAAEAVVSVVGQSLSIDNGAVVVTSEATVVVTGQSADIILGQYPVWIPVPVGPSDIWTPVVT